MDIRFNKSALDRLSPARPGRRDHYQDADFPSLSLRVTDKGVKTFVVVRRVVTKIVRVTLGRFPEMTVEQARRTAAGELALLVNGRNPNAERRSEVRQKMTLPQVLEDYISTRKKLKARTAKEYRECLELMFSDWLDRPIVSISRDMIAQRHSKIGLRSPAQADKGMRILRALFNFAQAAYEDGAGKPVVVDNPVKRLSKTKGWYGVRRRRTVIERHQLKPWFEAVLNLQPAKPGDGSEVVRDFLVFLLLTGLRKEEAASLRWEDVDFVGRKFLVPDTKNGDPHALPLSDYVYELLTRRREVAEISPFVFSSQESAKGYLQNPYKQMKRVVASSGVSFTLHDLRRTFTTTAESLDLSPYTIKRLINHRLPGDVTAGYIVIDTERLRAPIQRIADRILGACAED